MAACDPSCWLGDLRWRCVLDRIMGMSVMSGIIFRGYARLTRTPSLSLVNKNSSSIIKLVVMCYLFLFHWLFSELSVLALLWHRCFCLKSLQLPCTSVQGLGITPCDRDLAENHTHTCVCVCVCVLPTYSSASVVHICSYVIPTCCMNLYEIMKVNVIHWALKHHACLHCSVLERLKCPEPFSRFG